MALNIQKIQPFVAESNPAESWSRWKEDFDSYRLALKYHKEDQNVQIALFLQVCGAELKQRYLAFTFAALAEGQERTLSDVIQKFDDLYSAYKNNTMASFIFHGIKQEEGQSFGDYYNKIQLQANQCEFCSCGKERNIKDKVIHGLRDEHLRERLLRERSLTLDTLVEYCKAAEASHIHAMVMAKVTTSYSNTSVDAIEPRRPNRQFSNPFRPNEFKNFDSKNNKSRAVNTQQSTGNLAYKSNKSSYGTNQVDNPTSQRSCYNCGGQHQRGRCPAQGTQCRYCTKLNHWTRVCQQKRLNQTGHLNTLEKGKEQEEYSDDEYCDLGELFIDDMSASDSEWYETLKVGGNSVKFKLDTGAQINVLPRCTIEQWPIKPTMRPTQVRVFTYSGQQLPVMGQCTLRCTTGDKSLLQKFIILDKYKKPILGLPSCRDLKLVQRIPNLPLQVQVASMSQKVSQTTHVNIVNETPQSILEEYSDVFEGIGCLPGTYKITLKDNAVPHIASPRRIPQALQETVKKELSIMEQQGIIIREEEPTDWVNNLLVVQKKDSIRLCLDPLHLNAAIKRPHYKIPTQDDLIGKIQGTKLFSLFDAKKGFWHLRLDELSSKLTTFITPFGRYRFLRMPFGLNCAPEIFQMAMDKLFEGCPDINPYFDDVLLGANNMTSHCHQIRRLLQIAREATLKLNKDKLQLAVKSVRFLGHILTPEGIQPDQNKIQAIIDFQPPQNKEQLHRFLGMATYLMQYVPQFSNSTHLLRTLLKKEVTDFVWDSNMQKSFDILKTLLTKAPILQYFDQKLPLTISADASSFGVGAVLLQQNKPIAYTSAALTPSQQKYSQIEKELLAAVSALEHFHYYVYGRQIEVQTDHKPLLGLVQKAYHNASPRLQNLLMRWQRYQASLTFVPGKQLIIADTLSRAPVQSNTVDTTGQETISLCLLVTASDDRIKEIQQETIRDPELQMVLSYIHGGWPESIKEVEHLAQPYWQHRTELHYSQGLVCRGQRLVIPRSLRKDILDRLHSGHRGIVACKNKAREALFWPGLGQQIEQLVSACEACQRMQPQNQKEPLLYDIQIPEGPWQKIAIDLFHCMNQTFILVIDYFSKFVEVIPMQSTSVWKVTHVLDLIYARHGFPIEVMTDNGPPFNSRDFAMFNKTRHIKHTTSSPLFARSNGQVERAVQTIKNGLKKTQLSNLPTLLLDYRTTPSNGLPSPAEALMGRKLRSLYPVHPNLLKPTFPLNYITTTLAKRQKRQHQNADTHAKQLQPFDVNDDVWYWSGIRWKEGVIERRTSEPRSYIIKDYQGRQFRRNRFHLRKRNTMLHTNDVHQKPMGLPMTPEDYLPITDNITQEKTVMNSHDDKTIQQETNTGQTSRTNQVMVTRSGRMVIKPRRYKD